MSAWGKTDALGAKPKFPVERQVEPTITATANGVTNYLVTATANVITLLNATGVVAGQYVSGNNINYSSPTHGFFSGNVTVTSVDLPNNKVTLSAPLTANNVVGDYYYFDTAITYKPGTYETTYNADTILVTPTRIANATVNVNHSHTGWTHIRKKINSDGAVRYLAETLVVLANPSASNTNSGNTSNTQVYTGV
jgi:hypothetical protein